MSPIVNALNAMPKKQALMAGIGASFVGATLWYVTGNVGYKYPRTLQSDWQDATKKYRKENNLDPIYGPK